MYSLAFHGLLRVGEYTVTGSSNHVIQLQAVNFQVRAHLSAIFRVPHYKHTLKPVTLSIAKSSTLTICPVSNLIRYCSMRGSQKGPLLVGEDKSAMTSRQLSRSLRISIENQGAFPHFIHSA